MGVETGVGGICSEEQWIISAVELFKKNEKIIAVLAYLLFKSHFLSVTQNPCLWGRSEGKSTWHVGAVWRNEEKASEGVTVGYTLRDAWVSPRLHFTKLNGYLLGLVSTVVNKHTHIMYIYCIIVTGVQQSKRTNTRANENFWSAEKKEKRN